MSGGILQQCTGAKRHNMTRAVAPARSVVVGFGQLEVGIPVPAVGHPGARGRGTPGSTVSRGYLRQGQVRVMDTEKALTKSG